jgi:hypothetical protein
MKLRTLVTFTALAAVMAACAKAATDPGSGSPSQAGIAHATGAADLLLRVSSEGGFVPPSITLTRIPSFSLYGDGSIITVGVQDMIYPGTALPPILVQVVDEAGIQAILQAAIDAGLEDGTDHTDLGSVGIADASTTVFTFDADGVSHTVKVYALGELSERPPGMSPDEYTARQALADLEGKLTTIETWLPAGSAGPSQPFEAAGSRLYVGAYQPDAQLTEPSVAWPLDPPLASFGSSTDTSETRCGIVTGEDWTGTLRPLAEQANELTPWTSEGQRHAILFRPLLPDETAC